MSVGIMTADELLHLNLPDKRTELVKGVLVVRGPAGFRHGVVAARLTRQLLAFVDERESGYVLAAETGFKLESNPDTVRAPDAGFVRRDGVPAPLPKGFPALAPDIAVEVLSPDDRPGEVYAKVGLVERRVPSGVGARPGTLRRAGVPGGRK